MQAVIEGLSKFYPEFGLFFSTHYVFVKETSLTPTFVDGGIPTFKEDIKVRRRDLTEEDKNEYYARDLELWSVLHGDNKEEED